MSIELPSVNLYAERGHKKDAVFLWLNKLIPIWLEDDFKDDIFDLQYCERNTIADM